MSCKSRIVKLQKIREIKTKKNYSGETSPYWSFIEQRRGGDHKQGDHQAEQFESPLANPDIVAEADEPEENLTRHILRRGLTEIKFSPKEKLILALVSQGLTQEDVAKRLKLTRTRVKQAIIRVQKKGQRWYGDKSANGGLIREQEENL